MDPFPVDSMVKLEAMVVMGAAIENFCPDVKPWSLEYSPRAIRAWGHAGLASWGIGRTFGLASPPPSSVRHGRSPIHGGSGGRSTTTWTRLGRDSSVGTLEPRPDSGRRSASAIRPGLGRRLAPAVP